MPARSTSAQSSPPPPPATAELRPPAPHPNFSSLEEEETFLGPRDLPLGPSLGPDFVDGSDVDPQGTTSDRGSSPSEAKPLSKAALRGVIRRAIATGTGGANRMLSRNPIERDMGLWKADDEDLEGLSEPLAELAHRRGGITGIATANPDVVDGISVLIAFAGYLWKQLELRAQARAYAQAAMVHQAAPDEQPAAA